MEFAPDRENYFDGRNGHRGLVLHSARFGQHPLAPVPRQAHQRPAIIIHQIIGMNVKPEGPGRLERFEQPGGEERVTPQRLRGGEILAARERLGIEGVSGGEDQFFLCDAPGVSRAKAKVASGTRCSGGIA